MRVYFIYCFVLISSYQILRQFEALMGGSVHTPRQDTATSSHQATTNQLTTSTHSEPLLPNHSAGNPNLNHYQPDISPTGVTQPPNPPSSPSAQRDLPGQLMNDCDEEELAPILHDLVQNQSEPVRTAEVTSVAEESELNTSSSHPAEPQREQACLGRLSLFSGMELVTKGRPPCARETSQTETMGDGLMENLAVQNSLGISKTSDDAPLICNSVASDSSQPVSAFSFLNL